jgi:hypothetical protein
MPRIFISYRRDDTDGHAGRLFDDLGERFGRDQIVMDIATIAPGENFAELLREHVGSCEVLLALIGRRWLTMRDAKRQRRLDDPSDWVRVEIASALSRGVRVIPVLVGGAKMPRAERLPPDLQALAERQAVEITNSRWAFDVGRLVEGLEGASDTPPTPTSGSAPSPPWRWPPLSRLAAAGTLGVALLVTGALAWTTFGWPGIQSPEQQASPQAVAPRSVTTPPSPLAMGTAVKAPSSPAASPGPASAACSTSPGATVVFTYAPNTPIKPQTTDWGNPGATTLWALRSVGCSIPEEDLFDLLYPQYLSRDLGLLDSSLAGLARMLRGLGLSASNSSAVSFDEVTARAGRQPVILNARTWHNVGHTVGVREITSSGDLALANSAGDDRNFGQQTLSRAQFAAVGPVAALWIDLPPPPTPSPTPIPRRF